jgi:Flp pilus assembly pilin Flp
VTTPTPGAIRKTSSHAPATGAPRCRSRLARDERGALFVEYAALVAFVGLVVAVMLATLGPRVVRAYSERRAALYSHSP